MKTRLNITIEEGLLDRIKRYAAKKRISVSELVEGYFENLTRSADRQTIIDLVDQLEKSSLPEGKDLKKDFYEDQAKKYGF